MALNPEDENAPIAIWKVMSPGTHAAIVMNLEQDNDVAKVLLDFKQSPNGTTRDAAVNKIVRYTGNCIGQAALQEADSKSTGQLIFTPSDPSKSIFRVLTQGEIPISTVIGADSQTRDALHKGHDDVTVSLISRMTGRCVGQTLLGSGISLLSAVAKLKLL